MASGVPDHEVARLGALGHLPVVYRATRSDLVIQRGDVLRIAIHLKYVNFNQGAFLVHMPAHRDAISPKERRSGTSITKSGPGLPDHQRPAGTTISPIVSVRARLC